MGKKLHGEYSIEIFGDYCIEIDTAMNVPSVLKV